MLNQNVRTTKEAIKKAYETNFNKWRDYDLLTALIALIGLMLAIVDYEYTWVIANQQVKARGNYTDSEEFAEQQAMMRVELADVNFVRVVIAIISVLGVISLSFRHYRKAMWLNEDLPSEMTQNLYTHNMFDLDYDVKHGLMFKRRIWFGSRFWIEAFCLLVCPIPYWDCMFTIESLSILDRS